jgi:two-component system, chemotaxis family, protein-glutamate methylesterase/glutaminase
MNYKAVVIGTSAGGFHALSHLFKALPKDYHLPIIVVQHRSKDKTDLLEMVLQTKCEITIKQADEKEKIQPGVVYIAPANYHLLIERDHTFSLSSDELVKFSRPSIDVLFESAAAVYRGALVAIILTGASNDGAEGIRTVRTVGGYTIAQKPEEALYGFMPSSSIATKDIMKVWTLDEIQHFLLEITNK